jgi:hypothetical protein
MLSLLMAERPILESFGGSNNAGCPTSRMRAKFNKMNAVKIALGFCANCESRPLSAVILLTVR